MAHRATTVGRLTLMNDEYVEKLADMAATLVAVLTEERPIDEALAYAAMEYGSTASQMKYALSYARSRGWVVIDYDKGTVRTVDKPPGSEYAGRMDISGLKNGGEGRHKVLVALVLNAVKRGNEIRIEDAEAIADAFIASGLLRSAEPSQAEFEAGTLAITQAWLVAAAAGTSATPREFAKLFAQEALVAARHVES